MRETGTIKLVQPWVEMVTNSYRSQTVQLFSEQIGAVEEQCRTPTMYDTVQENEGTKQTFWDSHET